jgi:hypothetical protein
MTPETSRTRIVEAYEQMATEAKYRPKAPGDGFGGIFLDAGELAEEKRLRNEAISYAQHFIKEENGLDFWIGISCFKTVKAFVYAIEAARCLCAGSDFEKLASKLLKMAIRELGNEASTQSRRY